MMKEKNLLYLMAIMFFIMFSTITVLFIEGKISQREMSFHWENEQIITRLFQAFINGKSLNELIETDYPSVNSLGFYNYYGDPLYTYGDARTKFNNVTRTVQIDRKNSTVLIERDFLSPFDPFKQKYKNEINNNLTPGNKWTLKERENLIRFVTIDVYDDFINYFKIRLRIIQVLIILLILILILFFVNIYKKNMRYRNHIESTQRLVVLGTAARTLSHEIKNPLSIIRLQSNIIKRSGCEKHNISLKIVNDEVARITELTERVTDFLRHPTGYPEELNLNQTINDYIIKKEKNIIFNLPSEESLIYMDKNRFISVIDNIINNAIESGSTLDDISFTLENFNNTIQIVLIDKGKGISKENINKLLDPFFTTKSKGSGLGLSIVMSYLQAVNGSIKIDSELNIGTEILITIPRYKRIKEI